MPIVSHMPKSVVSRGPLDDLLVFHELARALTSTLDLASILRTILESMERFIDAELWALLMVDPEGRGGAGVNHWVAYGIPASVTGFAEGETSKASDKYVGGKSTQGVGSYSGPCTPPGSPHHYTFLVISTDLDAKELPPGLTHDEVTAKIAPNNGAPVHAKGSAGLIGLFVNPWKM